MEERRGTLEASNGSLQPDKKASPENGPAHVGATDSSSAPLFPVLDPTSVHSTQQPMARKKNIRFHYATGSRPLDGYTIKRGIGIGGFGEVYFALSDAGKEVALKRIQRNLDIELRGVKQCLNLKHVNLISLWDIRTCDVGESWVIMEYVPGDNLRDVIEQHTHGMPIDQVHFWFGATAAGVAYLHDRGIVHRDLKPGNIFRDMDEQLIKIGDYGLSKFISCSKRDGQTEAVGTFHYMAPEIGKGVYGKEIDVYALGIILFEMLTGRLPFEGESSQEIIMKHLTAIPDLNGIPSPYARVIGRALEKDPTRRYPSVAEMISQLPIDDVPNMPSYKALKESQSPAAGTAPPSNDSRPSVSSMLHGQPKFFIGDDQDIRFGEVQHAAQASHRKPPVTISDHGHHDPVSQPGPQEPIAKAVHSGWERVMHWWFYGNVSTPVKIGVLVGAILLLVINSAWLIPAVLSLGFVYLLYYLVLTLVSPADGAIVKARPLSKAEIATRVRHVLASRPTIDRVTESIGSLFLASLVCGTLGLLGFVVTNELNDVSSQPWAFYIWSVLISTSASWLILIASKFWGSSRRRIFGTPIGHDFVWSVGRMCWLLWTRLFTSQLECHSNAPRFRTDRTHLRNAKHRAFASQLLGFLCQSIHRAALVASIGSTSQDAVECLASGHEFDLGCLAGSDLWVATALELPDCPYHFGFDSVSRTLAVSRPLQTTRLSRH